MAKQWYIGCSGLYYREWKAIFYPKELPQSRWFDYYCQHFNTLKLNVTFYRFPELKSLQNWYKKSPDDYVFSAKVPRIITHTKKFIDTRDVLLQFYDVLLNGLQHKTGPVLFQLPPSFAYSTEKLALIVEQLDPTFQNVIEFRNISWWRPEVKETLQQHNITFCGVSYPGLPDDVVVTNNTLYYRFHGVPHLFHSPYTHDFIDRIKTGVDAATGLQKAFLYFNNTASAAALDNARYLKSRAGI